MTADRFLEILKLYGGIACLLWALWTFLWAILMYRSEELPFEIVMSARDEQREFRKKELTEACASGAILAVIGIALLLASQ